MSRRDNMSNDEKFQQLNDDRIDYEKNTNKKKIIRIIFIGVLIFALALSGAYIGTKWALDQNLIDDGTTVLHQAADRIINDVKYSKDEQELSIQQIAALTADSVVEIKTEAAAYSYFMQQYVTSGSGSGVILTSDGYIITCYHVIENATKIIVRLNNGTEYQAEIIGQDVDNDIAILRIEANDLLPVVLGDSSKMVVGDTVVVVGNPLGELGGTVTSGILSALDRAITIGDTKMNLLQTNAAVNPGNSGGALFNAYGELIGVVNAKSSGNSIEGLGFAIPINTIKEQIEQIIEQGYVSGKRALGITVIDVNNDYLMNQYGVSDYGIYITAIAEDSLAESVGLKVKDQIISINNIEVTTVNELQQLYKNCIAKEEVIIKIIRDDIERAITFTRE